MENINAEEFKRRIDKDDHLVLIDVRTPAEFEELHITGAKNIPLGSLNQDSLEKIAPKGCNLLFICQSGGRSSQASQKVDSFGSWNVTNVLGGTNAAKDAGMPITKGVRTVLSIERQVRVIAGTLVLSGVLLGFLLSSSFFYLSGIVGAGLIFAGLTNFCGMALVLEKCPWNHCSAKCEPKI